MLSLMEAQAHFFQNGHQSLSELDQYRQALSEEVRWRTGGSFCHLSWLGGAGLKESQDGTAPRWRQEDEASTGNVWRGHVAERVSLLSLPKQENIPVPPTLHGFTAEC